MCICICIRMFMYTYTYTISPAKLISEQGIQDCLRMYIQQWWTTSMCNLTVFFLQLCAHEPWWPWCASSDFQHDFPSHGYMAWSWTSMTKMRPANLFGRGIKVFNACFGNLYDPVAVLQHVARELLSEGGLVVRFSDFFDFWVQLGGAISCCNPWRCSFSTGSFFFVYPIPQVISHPLGRAWLRTLQEKDPQMADASGQQIFGPCPHPSESLSDLSGQHGME
jgi:hypothetical protein